MNLLNLTGALQIMESGEPFSVSCISLDRKRKRGGQKKFYSELIAMKSAKHLVASPKRKHVSKGDKISVPQNCTRKFYQCIQGRPTSTIKQIHLFGILEVNGIKMAL